ncbi:MAG: FlgD immunoglobulin-like domain containing protein, partial [Rhodothermales bacterium]|nr:FlgD immunoglobulin-like domain containing protein [Rhodothermales bacterium]
RIGGPANNVSIETNAPTLSWLLPAPSESALTYDVRYSKSPDLEANSTLVEGLTTPVAQLANLDAGDYYWQVRSKTASGEISPYSPVGSFTTTASFSVGVEDEFSEQPAAFELGQNYPNPFNPTTTIEFRMSESANVSLKVYNVLGQVVKTLVSGTLPSGMHSVSWDATDDSGSAVTTGLYIYRMETDNFSATKSLVLMK